MIENEKNIQKTINPQALFNVLLKLGILIVTLIVLFIAIPIIIKTTSYDIKSAKTTSLFLNILSNIAIISLPFLYVIITGKFMKGVLFSWFLQVLLAISFVYYGIVLMMFYKTKQIEGIHALDYYPDSPDVVITFMMGWIPALVLCGIAYGIHCVIKKKQTSID